MDFSWIFNYSKLGISSFQSIHDLVVFPSFANKINLNQTWHSDMTYIYIIYLIIQAACLENSLTKDEAQEPEKPPEEAVFVHPEMLGF